MEGDEKYHPADLSLIRYIRIRKAKEEGYNATIELCWLADFTDQVNMSIHDTRIRFGMATMCPSRQCIELVALAPAQFGGMETIQLIAWFNQDKPRYYLEIFDSGMSKRADYSFSSITEAETGLLTILESEYGDRIYFGG